MKKKKGGSKDLQKQLQTLIDSIERQFIILNKVDFNRLSELVEVRPKKLEAEHRLSIGLSQSEAEQENGKGKYYAVVIKYVHEEKLSSVEENEDKENVADLRIEYALNLLLKHTEEVKEVISEEDVLMKYAEGTGLLTVYPYIRHTADLLHREARIFIPPYPPMKVKPPK